MIFENLRIYLKEIKSINEKIQILKISLEESNNIKHFASKKSKKKKIAITKVLADLLELLTPLLILYFKNTNKIIKLIGTEKNYMKHQHFLKIIFIAKLVKMYY